MKLRAFSATFREGKSIASSVQLPYLSLHFFANYHELAIPGQPIAYLAYLFVDLESEWKG